jgi:uncharacterized protein YjcR
MQQRQRFLRVKNFTDQEKTQNESALHDNIFDATKIQKTAFG